MQGAPKTVAQASACDGRAGRNHRLHQSVIPVCPPFEGSISMETTILCATVLSKTLNGADCQSAAKFHPAPRLRRSRAVPPSAVASAANDHLAQALARQEEFHRFEL